MSSLADDNSETMSRRRAIEILRRILPPNSRGSNSDRNHKGVRGRIGIIGGARDYAGAPYFAAISSMRLGADLSYVICSRDASQVIKNYSPDLIVTPLLDCPDESEFQSEMDCLFTRLHAIVIGPGLGREKLVQDRARKVIQEARARSMPVILDADSLILINENPSIIKSYSKVLLTPNRIELQRMLDSVYAPSTFELRNMNTRDIGDLVAKCSRDLGVPILAKGMVDIISDGKSAQVQVDAETWGSTRRCGGQGDILSGIAAVYSYWIEQANKERKGEAHIENPMLWAGYLASLTTRVANELAFKRFGNSALASDMIGKIHEALGTLSLLSLNCDERGTTSGNDREVGIGGVASQNISAKTNTCEVTRARQKGGGKYAYSGSMTQDEINRYSRQMVMEEFGPERQAKLKEASVLIVGAGGLGCPAGAYLGASGIGRLGIVDDDRVETSNLHRQIMHNVRKVGMLKTESLRDEILALNPNVNIQTHPVRLDRHNAVGIVEQYDIVIDATDNLTSRYLVSDACVVAKKPLVSGAALKMDGQLTVYNYDAGTPCFRCLFPEPPAAAAVGSCSENGVLGAIPGVIGVQQALEAIKIAVGMRPAYAGKMLLFDGQLGLFRHIILGKRKPECRACGANSEIDRENLMDYEGFCGQRKSSGAANVNDLLTPDRRVTVQEYRDVLDSKSPHVLVDVRPKAQSDVSRLSHALQIPLMELADCGAASLAKIFKQLESERTNEVYVVCRRGFASQRGVLILQDLLADRHPNAIDVVRVRDVKGGMTAWAKQIDSDFSCL